MFSRLDYVFPADDTAGKILAPIFPITAFITLGGEHSVANMFLIPMGIILAQYPEVLATSNLTFITANLNWIGIWGNLIPVTLGNLVGGNDFQFPLLVYLYSW